MSKWRSWTRIAVGMAAAGLEAAAGSAAPPQPTVGPYLGVGTHALDPTMAPHVGLTPGFGLVVDYVDPEGAVPDALQEHDILVRLDDQRLVSPRQLSVLIRSYQPGDAITVGLIRAGERLDVEARLIERELAALQSDSEASPTVKVNLVPPVLNPFSRQGGFGPDYTVPQGFGDQIQESIRQQLQNLQLKQDEIRGVQDAVRRAMEESRDAYRPPLPSTGTARSLSASRVEVMERDGMRLTLMDANGDERLIAVGPDGEVLFDGSVNTAEERAALPAQVEAMFSSMRRSADRAPAPSSGFRPDWPGPSDPFGQDGPGGI